MPEEEPLLALRLLEPDQREFAGDLLPMEREHDSVLPPFAVIALPSVPDLDLPSAILACRNTPLETAKLYCVIFDLNRETLDPRLLRDSLWHCPALQHPVTLKPEIEVMRSGMMFLNHESRHEAETIIEV